MLLFMRLLVFDLVIGNTIVTRNGVYNQVRVPFLDKDMLDVTMELNPDYKLRIKVGISCFHAPEFDFLLSLLVLRAPIL